MKNTLRELRHRSNLTQIELAQKSGIPRCRIQLAEAGTIELRRDELQAIKQVVTPELARTAELLATELAGDERSITHQAKLTEGVRE